MRHIQSRSGVGWWVWLSCPELSACLREQVEGGGRCEVCSLAGEDLFISLDHVGDCLDGDILP